MRCLLVVVSFMSAFALFVVLIGISEAFKIGIAGEPFLYVATARRYNVDFLPQSAVDMMRESPGVESLTPVYNLPVYYRQPQNKFIAVGLSIEDFLTMFDIRLSDDAKQCLIDTRTGAIAATKLADQFDWQVGDQVPLISSHDLTRLADNNWPFRLCGTFFPPKQVKFEFITNFEFVDEYHIAPVRKFARFIVKVDDPTFIHGTALAIDGLFANERHATESIPLDEYQRRRARLRGENLASTVTLTLGAAFFVLILSMVCATSQSVRERKREFGVLRTAGFSVWFTLAMVSLEASSLALAGATLGIVPVVVFEQWIVAALLETVGRFAISPAVAMAGFGLALLVGFLAGAVSTIHHLWTPTAVLLR